MSTLRKFLWFIFLSASAAFTAGAADSAAARIILLANRNDPDSVRIAEHYAERRGVPRENIIALPMPQTETISWAEFVPTIWQPLQDELVRRKWLDAIPMAPVDAAGRKKYVINGHRIAYLITCRGVPLKIYNSDELNVRPPPSFVQTEFRTNSGAVDSELSLLARSDYPINGFVPNPLFRRDTPTEFEQVQVMKVSRLDGPTAQDANALVDHALEAERTGLLGRAYVDLANKYREGDGWLDADAKQLLALGFDLTVDRSSDTIPATARFDAPVLYFGWYAASACGPFLLPGFRFPPGAIAVHIYSFSAETLRAPTSNWCSNFLARGVTATVGNVWEPYLQFLHRPDLLLQALARGETFGDAAYYAEPVLSWQAIAIGDPLYRPFARSSAEQWRERARLPVELAGYAALNQMHALEMRSDNKASFAEVEEFQREHPSLPLGLALATKSELAHDRAGAARQLADFIPPEKFRPDEWELAREAAQLLQRVHAPALAERLYACLLRDGTLPPELRAVCLREGGSAAHAAGDAKPALEWARELGRLVPDERK